MPMKVWIVLGLEFLAFALLLFLPAGTIMCSAATVGSTTVPSGNRTHEENCRNAPLIVSEKQISQNGTGIVRNS
jgi:hypothetical protein